MSNIENRDISLQELVRNIDKNCYQIPKFQRDFVWDATDIEDLGDSIIRRYPISSVLLMPCNGTLKVGSHPLISDKESIDKESEYYILDGQQRITSISKLFLTLGDNKFEYYFDLLTMLVEKYPQDNILNNSGVKEKLLKSHLSDGFCRKFPISKDKGQQNTRQYNRFISGKSIIDDKFGSVVRRFLSEFKDISDDMIDKYTDYLNSELGKISSYSIPATMIAGDSELGVVIRVFEKVNSTGKKLTVFDLINAKSFQTEKEKYKGGLSDYLIDSINKNVIIGKYLTYSEVANFQDLLPRIVRIFEVAQLLFDNKIPALSQPAMLAREPDFWFEMWNKHGELLKNIIQWFNEENLVSIGQITFLEYSAAIFLASPQSFYLAEFKENIKKYALYLTLTERNFSKSDLDTVTKLNEMAKNIINMPTLTGLHEAPNFTSEKVLDGSKSKDTAILNVIYNQHKKIDWEYSHLFSSSRDKKGVFNSVANIFLIPKSNRESFKDKLIERINAKDYQALSYCKANLINCDEIVKVDSEQVEEVFIRNRAVLIAEIVNSYFSC